MNLTEFTERSYTCYHAAENGAAMLEAAGFCELTQGAALPAGAKGCYRVTGGSLFAARFGGDKLNLVLSHTDSPSLRLRVRPRDAGSAPLVPDVEKYGGGLLRSFLDRKLKIAGRVIERSEKGLVTRTVCSSFCTVIPSLAVHLGGGKEGEELTVSRDLRPLIEGEDWGVALGCPDAVDGDLYCVPAETPFFAGANEEYFCSPRIDNLVSVYASIRALIDCRPTATCVIACFNSEETGSETREGAQSQLLFAFLQDALRAEKSKADARAILRCSFALSCDGAHALHPSHREKYGENPPTLGGGVVIKRNDRYASDGLTAATARTVFADAGAATQTYYHHPDLRCGSTIGLTAAHTLGASVCDIGVAQLAMHAALETAARKDIDALVAGLTGYFGREITVTDDGIELK